MARVKIAGTTGSSENTIVFSPAGGHSHDGRNSSLINSTAYSMYDFSPTFVGTEVNPDRAVRQENNRIAFEDVIKRVVNNSVLAPAGIRLEPGSLNGSLIIANTITANQLAANTITAAEISAGTITANELSSNIVLINNRITSQNWNGTISANGTILSNNIGSAGWAITNTHAVFDSTLIRGSIAANSLVTPNLTISNTGAIISTNFNMTAGGNITANNASIIGSINAGSSITLGSPVNFSVNSSGSITAKTGVIGPVNITTSSMNSQGSSPYLNTNSNYYNFDNFGDIYIYSNPGSDVGGPHVNQYHQTALVGEYIQIKKSSTSAFSDNLYEARIGSTSGTYAEVVVQNTGTPNYVAMYSTGNISLSGEINGYGFTSGRHNGANQMVHTDGNGYLQVGYINSSNGNEGNDSNPSRVWGTNGSDDYLRSYLTSALSVAYATRSFDQDLFKSNSPEFSKVYLSALGPSDSDEVLVRISTGEVKKRNHTASWSLRHMKEDIKELTGCLDKLKTLQPKTFIFKEDYINKDEHFGILDQFDRRTQLQYGFIVDEVKESSVPDLVQYRINDDKTLYPRAWKAEGLLTIAVGAIQELSEKVSQLETRIIELEGV